MQPDVEIFDSHITPEPHWRYVLENGQLRLYEAADRSRYAPDDPAVRAEVFLERYLAIMGATGIKGMILQGPTMLSATDAGAFGAINRMGVDPEAASLESIVTSRHPDKFAFWLRVDHGTRDLEGVVREARRRPGWSCSMSTQTAPAQSSTRGLQGGTTATPDSHAWTAGPELWTTMPKR